MLELEQKLPNFLGPYISDAFTMFGKNGLISLGRPSRPICSRMPNRPQNWKCTFEVGIWVSNILLGQDIQNSKVFRVTFVPQTYLLEPI